MKNNLEAKQQQIRQIEELLEAKQQHLKEIEESFIDLTTLFKEIHPKNFSQHLYAYRKSKNICPKICYIIKMIKENNIKHFLEK